MEGELGRERTQGTRGLVELYLHQGIGVEYGNLLTKAGIRSLADLAALSAEQVEDRTKCASRDMFDGPPRRKFACGFGEFQDLDPSRIG